MSASHRAVCIPLQSADSLSLGSKRSGRIRLQKTQPKRRRFETVCRSLQRDADRSLLRSIAPGWTGLCGRKVCSRAWCPAPRMRRWARSGSRDKASFWQMRSFFQTVWFVNASRSPVGRSARRFGCFPLCRLALSRRYSIDLLFGSQYLSPAGTVTPVGRSAKPYAVQDHLKTTVFMLRLLQHYAPLRFY